MWILRILFSVIPYDKPKFVTTLIIFHLFNYSYRKVQNKHDNYSTL